MRMPLRTALPLTATLLLAGPWAAGEVTEKHRAFAGKLVEKLDAGNPAALVPDIDHAGFVARCIGDLKVKPAFAKDPAFLVKSSGLCMATRQGYQLTLLRVREIDNGVRALIRSHWGTTRSYFDALLIDAQDGSVKLQDIFIYGLGNWVSGSQHYALGLATEAGPKKAEAAKALNVRNAFLSAPYPRVKADYLTLPAARREAPDMLAARLLGAMQHFDTKDEPSAADEKEYLDAALAYAKARPDTPTSNMLLASVYQQIGKHREALPYLGKSEKQFGGCALIRASRANALWNLEKDAEAEKELLGAIRDEPDLDATYLKLIEFRVFAENYAGALKTLQEADKRGLVDVEALAGEEDYADWVRTPAFQKWMKSRKK